VDVSDQECGQFKEECPVRSNRQSPWQPKRRIPNLYHIDNPHEPRQDLWSFVAQWGAALALEWIELLKEERRNIGCRYGGVECGEAAWFVR
jgi:hypothetical protein